MKTVKSDSAGLAAAAAALNAGQVVVIPTDTVYGLAARPDFPEAVARLYTIKGRAEGKPIALLASGAEAAGRYISPEAVALASPHWPGALTVVSRGEGVRVPDHGWTRARIAECGGALRVTSANLSGRKEATDAAAALSDVGLSADIVVDDGVSPGGVPSTVVKVGDGGAVEILREGAVKL
jgi:tRNA threonylcarbamoyl adenosine modification protein (Sua5/YciO/YrdC/YwlC family)